MMSSRSKARFEIGLYTAAAAVLIALLAWVWTQPHHTEAQWPTGTKNPCALMVGPAADYCKQSAASASSSPQDADSTTTAAADGPQLRVWRGDSFLVPATIAVAAAVGLVMAAGRRTR